MFWSLSFQKTLHGLKHNFHFWIDAGNVVQVIITFLGSELVGENKETTYVSQRLQQVNVIIQLMTDYWIHIINEEALRSTENASDLTNHVFSLSSNPEYIN